MCCSIVSEIWPDLFAFWPPQFLQFHFESKPVFSGSIKFVPVSVWFPVSRLSLQLFCLPSLMLRSLHLIEVEGIIAKKKKNPELAKLTSC